MKYNYHFETSKNKPGLKLTIRLPEGLKVIETFLGTEVQYQDDAEDILNAIDKVLNNRFDCREMTGNVCNLEIRREKTKVYNALSSSSRGNECEIETSELRELIIIWLEEKAKYDSRFSY